MVSSKLLADASRISLYPPHRATQALLDFLQVLRNSLDAAGVIWLIAYQGRYGRELWHVELMDGWKIMDVINPDITETVQQDLTQEFFETAARQGGVDPMTSKALKSTGSHRTHWLKETLETSESGEHWIKSEFLDKQDISDRMLGIFNVGVTTESYVIVDRNIDQPSFTREERNLLGEIVQLFPRLHYWMALERGLTSSCEKPLSPRQRTLANLVLQGKSEDEIGLALGLTKATVHTYLMQIYKCLSVNSKAEMILKWLDDLQERGGQ